LNENSARQLDFELAFSVKCPPYWLVSILSQTSGLATENRIWSTPVLISIVGAPIFRRDIVAEIPFRKNENSSEITFLPNKLC
jgi:hypothetical protein